MNRVAACRERGLRLLMVLTLCAATPCLSNARDASGDEGGDLAPLASSLSVESAGTAEAAGTAGAAEAGGAENGIAVQLARGPAGMAIEGRFVIAAPTAIVWSVLTDYDSIARFVTSMRSSHVVGRSSDTLFVDQQAVGRLLLFSHRLHTSLRIEEEPPTRIRFVDLLGRDFRSYRGEWRIEPGASGATVIYRLEADPSFPIPDFVARGLFRSTARELLSQVRTEIERRAALAAR